MESHCFVCLFIITGAISFNRDEAKDSNDLGIKASFQENKFYFELRGNVYRREARE